MIDRFENIADLHEEVLTFLLDYKEREQSDLTFLLNNPNNSRDRKALEKGWWFKGNESYLNLYFTINENHRTFFKNNFQITINKYGALQLNFYFEHHFDIKLEDKIVAKFQKVGILKTHQKNRNYRDFSIIPNENEADYRLQLGNIIQIIQDFLESPMFQEQDILTKVQLVNFKNNLNFIENIRKNNKVKSVYFNKIIVDNYYSIKKTTIQEIPNDTKWLFLTGENGAGKTLILQSIAIGLYGKNEKLILPQNKETRIEVNYQSINTIRNINYHNSTEYLDFFRPLENLACYGPFRLDIQSESSENQESKRSSPIYGLFGNYDMLLKNIETELKFSYYENKTKFEQLTEMLKQVIPTLHDIEFDAKNRKVYYYEKNGQNKTEIYEKVSYLELATGVKSIIAMVGDIYIRFSKNQPSEYLAPEDLYGIVIIDELDLHLHPKWQKSLPSLLSNVFPNIQFIASTHSAIPILGAPENSVLLRVNRNKEDGITVERLEYLENQLKDLTPNLILTSEIFGLQNIFPVTHDKSQRIRTEDTMAELQENDEMMEALKSYMNTDKEDELLKLFSK